MTRSETCKRILRHLDAYVVSELDPGRSREIEEHLNECVTCREERNRRMLFQSLLEEALAPQPAPSGFADQVMFSVRREAESMQTRDWGFPGLVLGLAALGMLLSISGLIVWLVGSGIPPEVWWEVTVRQMSDASRDVSSWWDLGMMRAKWEWIRLVGLPAGMWSEMNGLKDWWSHPAVPAAVLLSFTGMIAWSLSLKRTGETAS
ncbi:anti-sigma factor family protein [Staphylospora marina]|uniref:anti-sigma factor family protein n=1 Tax=Staphylospora marina TaxID=2490858 RepID=UPI000F5BEFBD|nr:zf-HC2 domain-containing protein [Staphylospora marina]